MLSIDAPIVLAFNSFAHAHPFASYAAVFFALYLPYLLGISILIFIFSGIHHQHISRRGHVALVATLAGLIARFPVKLIIVLWYEASRPYVALTDITLLIPPILTEELMTFPSGHALFFFAIATVLYLYHKKLGIFFYISAIFMGMARIMVGVHYPSDIIGGALIGILVGFACSKLLISRNHVAQQSFKRDAISN